MGLTFYYLSGSPFAWKVWLALEHKAIAHERVTLSAERGELKRPEFLRINPRAKAPAIVHDGFVLYESSAIVDYLDDAFGGAPLWPDDARARAVARRIAGEANDYVYPSVRRLVVELLMTRNAPPNEATIAEARASLSLELGRAAEALSGRFAAGDSPTIADYTLYPLVAILVRRLHVKHPARELAALVPEELVRWMRSVESLPHFDATFPPHWERSR